jgi:hypothetical protein
MTSIFIVEDNLVDHTLHHPFLDPQAMVHYPMQSRPPPGWEAFHNDAEHGHDGEEVEVRLDGLEDVSLSGGTVGGTSRTHFELAPSPDHRPPPVTSVSNDDTSPTAARGLAWVALTVFLSSGE